jgi:hypothetical protein
MIEHLTLVIAGGCLVAYAEWVKPRPGLRERLVDVLWYGGAFVFLRRHAVGAHGRPGDRRMSEIAAAWLIGILTGASIVGIVAAVRGR